MPVVLNAFELESDGKCHFQIASPQGIPLVNLYIDSLIASETQQVLSKAAKYSRGTQRGVRVVSIISKPEQVATTWNYTFQLSVKILVRDSRDFAEGSSKVRDLLELCAPSNNSDIWEAWSPRDFYDNVFVPDRSEPAIFSHKDQLGCQLYPFQARAVKWLLRREGFVHNGTDSIAAEGEGATALPHGFVETIDADGQRCFISHILGVITTDKYSIVQLYSGLKGGILAEEMGLGKTVEICALISLHQQETTVETKGTLSGGLQSTQATLIITLPSLRKQWESELKAHSPNLKVKVYEGLRRNARNAAAQTDAQIRESFSQSDVVLATYSVLADELNYAPQPLRDLRHEKRYTRRVSPITQFMWWRVVLDEAQMIEGGTNKAAQVAQLIPRHNAWAVSGTPVRKNAKDLLGLLVFLRFQPYCKNPEIWDYLVLRRRDIFKEIFGKICLRHTKEQIRDEIQLPPQKRVVISVPFTHIEEQHYSTIYQEMCDDCGLNLDGSPLANTWDPKSPTTIHNMRNWLSRLRQTCLHPDIGAKNRQALGGRRGPLRTVAEVLEVMVEQNHVLGRAEERALLLSQIRRGQLLEHSNRSKDALEIWLHTLDEAKLVVEDCRQRFKSVLDEITEHAEVEMIQPESLPANRSGVYRQRLRSALEVEHMCTFFVANAYYQIKTDTNLTQVNSVNYRDLDKLEEENYEKAKLLRMELLAEAHRKAEGLMTKVKKKSRHEFFVEIAPIKSLSHYGGIESRNLAIKARGLIDILQREANQFKQWRNKLVGLLLLPLVDEENSELQGDEYEASKAQQDQLYVYMDVLRLLVADLHELLTGQNTGRVDHEMHVALERANTGGESISALIRSVLSVRNQLKPSKGSGSLRGIITELRDMKTLFRNQAENGNSRTAVELAIAHSLLQDLHDISIEQTKSLSAIDRELEVFKDTMNARLDYYRQLQQISDALTFNSRDLSNEDLVTTLLSMQEAEGRMKDRIATLRARDRYLLHLRNETTTYGSQRMCVICQQPFEVGVLTICGHSFCVECLRLWWSAHRNCPTCKKNLSSKDLNQITYVCSPSNYIRGLLPESNSYKPQELIAEEAQPSEEAVAPVASPGATTIYSDIRDATFNQIKNIDVNGSFGTKIDTLARHMLWIRANDPGAKSIVFSQYKEFLDVLAKAFTRFKIGFTGIDRKDGIESFKADPSVRTIYFSLLLMSLLTIHSWNAFSFTRRLILLG